MNRREFLEGSAAASALVLVPGWGTEGTKVANIVVAREAWDNNAEVLRACVDPGCKAAMVDLKDKEFRNQGRFWGEGSFGESVIPVVEAMIKSPWLEASDVDSIWLRLELSQDAMDRLCETISYCDDPDFSMYIGATEAQAERLRDAGDRMALERMSQGPEVS